MNTSAIVMMIISMLFLWGGLALSILHLSKNPEELDEVLEEVKDQHTLSRNKKTAHLIGLLFHGEYEKLSVVLRVESVFYKGIGMMQQNAVVIGRFGSEAKIFAASWQLENC